MGFRTDQIHAGAAPDPVTGAILTPIHQTSTFAQPSVEEYMAKGYSYSRSANPTVSAFAERMAVLEGGHSGWAFATGMAATDAVFRSLLNAGDHAVVGDVTYGGTYRLATQIYARYGVEFTFADGSDPEAVEAAVTDRTRLIFTETPANPTLKYSDIAAISRIARSRGIPHAVDNTFLTPYFQRPLELGADLAVHSTTKYIDGLNATVGGAVVCAGPELSEKIGFIQNATGTIMSPMTAWISLQSSKTLSERMERQSANAAAVAGYLEGHPKVARVAYPGLASFPWHRLASRQASGYGAMAWFELEGGLEAGARLMSSVRLWTLAESLGSVESLITHPVTMTHADVDEAERLRTGITDGLVRISVGLEDAADLIADLDAALREA